MFVFWGPDVHDAVQPSGCDPRNFAPKRGKAISGTRGKRYSLREMVSVGQLKGSTIQDRVESEGLSGGVAEESHGMKRAET